MDEEEFKDKYNYGIASCCRSCIYNEWERIGEEYYFYCIHPNVLKVENGKVEVLEDGKCDLYEE